jgi:hypothetical protein
LPKNDVDTDRRNLVRPGIGKLEPNPLTGDDRVLEPAFRGREHGDDETRVKLRSGGLKQNLKLPSRRGFRVSLGRLSLWTGERCIRSVYSHKVSDDSCTGYRLMLRSVDSARNNQLVGWARRTLRLLQSWCHRSVGDHRKDKNGDLRHPVTLTKSGPRCLTARA